MTGVFKDLENKTKFAILFTKHYTAIYREFVRDDHYRSASATAVSVQLYTVTTIVCNCVYLLAVPLLPICVPRM